MRTLIKNGHVHRFDKQGKSFFDIKNILIEDDKIIKIYDCKELGDVYDKIIEAKDCAIIPGLINAHVHTHCHFTKGCFDNMPLEIWMLYLRPFYSGMSANADEIYIRTLFSCIEPLKTGTTCMIDDLVQMPLFDEHNLKKIFAAYKKAGMRATITTYINNKPIHNTIPYLEELFDNKRKASIKKSPPEDEILDYLERQLQYYNNPDAIQRYALSPAGPQRCTVKLMQGMRYLSEKYNVPMMSHVMESRAQRMTGDYYFGKSLVKYLMENDLLFENFLSIHSVWLDDEDIEILNRYKCSVAHNPASNLKLGSGVAPINKMVKKGINIGLGTDNTSCSDTLNLFDAIKLSALLQKVETLDYHQWTGAQDAIRMATLGGAGCALLQDEIGSLEVGKKADLVILDLNNERLIPHNDLVLQLVYCENGSSVRDVMINGQLTVENKKITTFDERAVIDEFKKVSIKLAFEQGLARTEAEGIFNLFEEAYYKSANFKK